MISQAGGCENSPSKLEPQGGGGGQVSFDYVAEEDFVVATGGSAEDVAEALKQ